MEIETEERRWVHTKLSNVSLKSSNLSPKALKISDEAMIDVLHKALLGFLMAFITASITFSLCQSHKC
uniref:Uncharacterized protein n=1 Tax=Rhizophora mucronata TaxID=61149 RepID=A0A2P2R0R9_RHIMU